MLEDFIVNCFALIGVLTVLTVILLIIETMIEKHKTRQKLKHQRDKWRGVAIEQR